METLKPAAETDAADLEEVHRLLAEGRPVTDPELLRRIRERSERASQEIFRRHGLLDVAVGLIRETRDEG